MQTDLSQGLFIELEAFGLTCSTEDKNIGTTAFMKKEKPKFVGK